MNPGSGRSLPSWATPLLLMALAVLVRGLFLVHINLDADMAVTGLMGRHILQGGHWPIFFYGQPFCGSIEAYVAAAVFALLGSSPLTLSLAPTLVGLTFVLVAYLAAKDMWGRQAGLWSMIFAACPPYYFAVHNVLPRAAYIEVPLFSLLLIWLAFRLVHRNGAWWLYLVYGLVAGVGFWTHFLIAYALVATAVYIVAANWRILLRRGHVLIWLGFLLGSLPLWIYNLRNEWATFTFLVQPKESVSAWEVLRSLLAMAAPILLGGFREGTQQPVVPVISYGVYALGLVALGYLVWLRRNGLGRLARLDASRCDGSELYLLMILAGVLITAIKGEPVAMSRRHYVPLYAAIIPLAGYALATLGQKRRVLALALAGVALASNLAGVLTGNAVLNSQLRQDMLSQISERRQVIDDLLGRGVTRAYSLDYWNCPLITFESGERLLVVMPQDELSHFYEPNARLVAQAPRVAYLGRRDSHAIRQMLKSMDAGHNEVKLGSYTAFVDIRPAFQGLREVPSESWRGTASLLATDAPYAFDGDALTRWSPLEPQRPGQTLEIDLGEVVPDLCLLRLASGRVDDHPRCAQLFLSVDGASWQRVTKLGTVECPFFFSAGQALTTPGNTLLDLGFNPRPARYLRLVQTCTWDYNYWSVQELSLYRTAPAGPKPEPAAVVAFARDQGITQLFAEASLRGYVPNDMRPRPQKPPRLLAWPLELSPNQVLSRDFGGVMLAVETHDGPRLSRFLTAQGMGFDSRDIGGHSVFWRIRPLVSAYQKISMHGGTLRSSNTSGEVRMLDGNPATAWDSGRTMQAGDFMELIMPAPIQLSAVVLDNRQNPRELPRGLVLSVSADGKDWQDISYQIQPLGPFYFIGDRLLSCNAGRVRLAFKTTNARFIRLSLSQGHARERWSIYEMELEVAATETGASPGER